MVVALDEASLFPCAARSPAQRIQQLAETVLAVDATGAPRLLQCVRDAADRDIGDGWGLRLWCFDRHTPKDAGRLVASRLGKVPFIDGESGLFRTVAGEREMDAFVGDVRSIAGGYAALSQGLLLFLSRQTWPPRVPVVVRLDSLAGDELVSEEIEVASAASSCDVEFMAASLRARLFQAVENGKVLRQRLPELFPRIVLGTLAMAQVDSLTGDEEYFQQILRHFSALDRGAMAWRQGTSFSPEGISFSVESGATLTHGIFGPERDFPIPMGFPEGRWTLHTKITGGPGARLYYKVQEFSNAAEPSSPETQLRVAVGYVGPHLRTVKFQ